MIGTVFGLAWLAMILLVPIAFIYFLIKKMWASAFATGLLLSAIAATLWLVSSLKYG